MINIRYNECLSLLYVSAKLIQQSQIPPYLYAPQDLLSQYFYISSLLFSPTEEIGIICQFHCFTEGLILPALMQSYLAKLALNFV